MRLFRWRRPVAGLVASSLVTPLLALLPAAHASAAPTPPWRPLHVFPTLGSDQGSASTGDTTLLQHLAIQVCQVKPDSCPTVAVLTNINQTPDKTIYTTNWNPSSSGVTAGSSYLFTFRVDGLNVGTVTAKAISLLQAHPNGTFYAQLPNTFSFRVDRDPVIRTRLLHQAGLDTVSITNALRQEFGLNDVLTTLYMYNDVRNQDVTGAAASGTAGVRSASPTGPTPFGAQEIVDALTSPFTYYDTAARTASVMVNQTSFEDLDIVNGLVNTANQNFTVDQVFGAIALVPGMGITNAQTAVNLLSLATRAGSPAFDATQVLTAFGDINGAPTVLQGLTLLSGVPGGSGSLFSPLQVLSAGATVLNAGPLALMQGALQIPALPFPGISSGLQSIFSLSPGDITSFAQTAATNLACSPVFAPLSSGVAKQLADILFKVGDKAGDVVSLLATTASQGGCGYNALEVARVLDSSTYGLAAPGFVATAAPLLPATGNSGIAAALRFVYGLTDSGATGLLAPSFPFTTVATALGDAFFNNLTGAAFATPIAKDLAKSWPSSLPPLTSVNIINGVGTALQHNGIVGAGLECATSAAAVSPQGAAMSLTDTKSGLLASLDNPEVQSLLPNALSSGPGGNLAVLGGCLASLGIPIPFPLLKLTVHLNQVKLPGVTVGIDQGQLVGRVGYSTKLGPVAVPPASAGLLSGIGELPVFAAGPDNFYNLDINCDFDDCTHDVKDLPSLANTGNGPLASVFKIKNALTGPPPTPGDFTMVVPAFIPGTVNVEGDFLTAANGGDCFSDTPDVAHEALGISLPNALYSSLASNNDDVVAVAQQSYDIPNDHAIPQQLIHADMVYHQQCGRLNAFGHAGFFAGSFSTTYLKSIKDIAEATQQTAVSVTGATLGTGTSAINGNIPASGSGLLGAVINLANIQSITGNYLSLISQAGLPAGTTGVGIAQLLTTGFLP